MMITWTLLYISLWFSFGIFFGFRRTFEQMFIDIKMSKYQFNITISPAFIVYLVGLGALAVS